MRCALRIAQLCGEVNYNQTLHCQQQKQNTSNALSMTMHLLIPLQELFCTIGLSLGIQEESITYFKTTVWEDNQGCLTLANMEPGQNTPRSKHYAIKQH